MTVSLAALVLATVGAMASMAHAQFPGGGGGGGRGGMGGGMGGGPPGRSAADGPRAGPAASAGDVVAQTELNLSSLAEDLRLTSAQVNAWTRYADRLRKFADDVARNRSALRFPQDPAPHQFDLLVGSATNRLTAIEEVADAGRKFYETLTPDQREIADRRLARIVAPLVTGDAPPGMSGTGGAGSAAPRGGGTRGGPGAAP